MTENLIYEDRLIAFIDIMGFKDIISESTENQEKLRVIREALEFLKSWEASSKWDIKLIEIEESAQKRGLDEFEIMPNCTCFSDSIVVSVNTDSHNVNEIFSTLVSRLSCIGAELISKGILIRGAITIGKLIHSNDGVVFGQALIDAYTLENSTAVYPRIILSDRLVSYLNYPILRKADRYPYHQYLSRFNDGCVGFTQLTYFQVFQSWEEMSLDTLKSELEKVRRTIVSGLDASFENSRVYAKYKWLQEQYNELIILDDGIKGAIPKIPSQNIHHLL